jgi:hypothetical protein
VLRSGWPSASLLLLIACRGPTDEAGDEIASASESQTESTGESDGSGESDETASGTETDTDGETSTTDETGDGDSELGSLRFHGHGVDAPGLDRVKIAIDDPDTDAPGPPADVGAEDFTIELWLRAEPGSNQSEPVECGPNLAWIYGNIVLDRDRYNQDRKFGLSLAGGRPVFGVSGEGTGDQTICGDGDLRDGAWHHLAVQRRRSDGRMWLFVDGIRVAEQDGPDGDVSYPDDGVPGDFCGGPCLASDPFLVLAAEKHDAGADYPSFDGWLTGLRLSTVLRYTDDFTPPTAPFTTDPDTAALYRFDEGRGTVLGDGSGAAGGPSDGVLHVGGDPSGPEWSSESPW